MVATVTDLEAEIDETHRDLRQLVLNPLLAIESRLAAVHVQDGLPKQHRIRAIAATEDDW